MVDAWQLLKGAEFAANVYSSNKGPSRILSFLILILGGADNVVSANVLSNFLHNFSALYSRVNKNFWNNIIGKGLA